MAKSVWVFPVIAGAFLFGMSTHAATKDEAIAVIAHLHGALVEVAATEPSLSSEQRFEVLAPVIGSTHDLATMGRLTVRRFWRRWSENQRNAFVDTFSRLSVTTYASRFSSVGPDTFEIVGGEIISDNRSEVEALIHRRDAEDVSMNYLLQLDGESWRVINVFAGGASELSLMGSEYFAILESGDFDDLIAELELQITEM